MPDHALTMREMGPAAGVADGPAPIANGIAFGFISYAAVKLLAGRIKEVSPGVLALAILFVIKFAVS